MYIYIYIYIYITKFVRPSGHEACVIVPRPPKKTIHFCLIFDFIERLFGGKSHAAFIAPLEHLFDPCTLHGPMLLDLLSENPIDSFIVF